MARCLANILADYLAIYFIVKFAFFLNGRGVGIIVEIISCNNVDQGTIEIKEGKLNIKYAINGTGKSTVAKAISAAVIDCVFQPKSATKYRAK